MVRCNVAWDDKRGRALRSLEIVCAQFQAADLDEESWGISSHPTMQTAIRLQTLR
jgi:hypothetical protein